MRSLLLCTLLLFSAAVCAAAAEPPSWIWYPAGDPSRSAPIGECFLRGRFTLPAAPTAATLAITADDTFEVFVNGHRAAAEENLDSWSQVKTAPVAPLLVAGENVIAVRCRNASSSPAGLCARLDWKAGEQSGALVTDTGWRTALTAPEGWEQPGFVATDWQPAFAAPIAAWNLPFQERVKLDPAVQDEALPFVKRVVQPDRKRWPKRPAPAKLLCTTAWLGGPGAFTLEKFKEYASHAARAGFHVISLGITWRDAEPRPGEWNLAFVDNAITYAANQGLWLQVRLVSRPIPDWLQSEAIRQVDHTGKKANVHVFTDAALNAQLARFYRAIATRYRGYPILSYSSAFSEAAETEYCTGFPWRDYSPSAVAHFRAFLKKRYPSLAALNKAWGTHYTAWSAVQPEFHGDGLTDHPARFSDWMRQREQAMLELNTLLAKALKAGDPNAQYAVQCGRIYSGECAGRGTVGVGNWARAADWIITDPAPLDDVRWQAAVDRCFGKNGVAELDGLYAYDRDKADPMTVMPRQVRDGFAAGIRMMQLCHWYPKDVARYPDLFSVLGKVAREANNRVPAARTALWVGKWDLYRAAAVGGDPSGVCAQTYRELTAAGDAPDVITDDVVRAHPEVLKRYRRIVAPALAWIERDMYERLRATGKLQLPAGQIKFQSPSGETWQDWRGADALLKRARAAHPNGAAARLLAAAEAARRKGDVVTAATTLTLLQSWLRNPRAFTGRLFLVAECAVDDSAMEPGKSNGVRFLARLRAGGKEQTLLTQDVTQAGWQRQVIALDAAGPAEIELIADPLGNFAWDRGCWGDVRLVYAPDATAAASAPAFYHFAEHIGDARLFLRTAEGEEALGRGAAFARSQATVGRETRPAISAIPPWQGAMGQTCAVFPVFLP